MNILKPFILIALISQSSMLIAEESTDSAVGSNLPPKVRGLLIQEMAIVLDATKKILQALVSGQDEIVAENAQAIHDSFIMEKEMTEADKKALKSAVPAAFLERDIAFHKLTARLADAARKGNEPLQMQLFTEMVNACTECHSKHATDRFPGFGRQ